VIGVGIFDKFKRRKIGQEELILEEEKPTVSVSKPTHQLDTGAKKTKIMTKENKAKIKELNKTLMKIVRQNMKPYGFKAKSNVIWIVQNDFFFKMVHLLCLVCQWLMIT